MPGKSTSESVRDKKSGESEKAASTLLEAGKNLLKQDAKGTIKMAKGGPVPGKGNKDTVAAKLTPGEFVVRKSAAKAHGPALRSMNRMGPARMRRD